MSDGYRNQSAGAKKTWVPVIAPTPLFDSAQQALDTVAAIRAHPRRPGEELADYMHRIGTIAGLIPGRPAGPEQPELRLPYTEPPEGLPAWARPAREPGSDDE